MIILDDQLPRLPGIVHAFNFLQQDIYLTITFFRWSSWKKPIKTKIPPVISRGVMVNNEHYEQAKVEITDKERNDTCYFILKENEKLYVVVRRCINIPNSIFDCVSISKERYKELLCLTTKNPDIGCQFFRNPYLVSDK
jgi:hypothetical protein